MAQEREPLRGTGDVATIEGRRAYLDAVASLVQEEGLFVDPSTWSEHLQSARLALDEQNVLAVLRHEVSELVNVAGGEHSAYLWATVEISPLLLPEVTTQQGVSRVVVPGGGGADVAEIGVYARAGVGGIHAAAADTSCGWIVDVRGNQGGGSWPMLAAVAPLLPEGSLGGLMTGDGDLLAVKHGPGWVTQDGAFRFEYHASFNVDQPVAVLIDNQTASAAEALTTAFHGQPNTQIIGRRSAGFATGNATWPLQDGSRIVLTTSWMVDAEGTRFPDGIEPQITLPPQADQVASNEDPVIQAAEEWLRNACT